jgi:hypothetical protein
LPHDVGSIRVSLYRRRNYRSVEFFGFLEAAGKGLLEVVTERIAHLLWRLLGQAQLNGSCFPSPHHELVMGSNLCPYCFRTYRILHAMNEVVVDAILYVGAFVGFTENPFVVRFVFGKQQGTPASQ